jgi:uroporphyrinogen-III synthase
MSTQPLQGLRVLVTRPAHQAAHLCELIRAAGGEPISLPVLAIEPPRDPAAARALIMRLNEFDLAVFVSANAAERGLALIREHGPLPAHIKVAAVGERTAAILVQAGAPVHITAPPPFDSEALLTCPELRAVAARRIVIFRGEGGREWLAETLRQRGAEVSYAEVYRRVVPQADLAGVVDRAGEIAVVVVTSRDGLRNLTGLAEAAGRRDWLLSRQLAVISERVAQQAAALGFAQPALVAPRASDPGLVAAIAAWRRGAQAAQ